MGTEGRRRTWSFWAWQPWQILRVREAAHAVAMFKRAHVRTVMITGDHRDTALAIARRLGIAEDGTQCISGAELDRMDDAALKERQKRRRSFPGSPRTIRCGSSGR